MNTKKAIFSFPGGSRSDLIVVVEEQKRPERENFFRSLSSAEWKEQNSDSAKAAVKAVEYQCRSKKATLLSGIIIIVVSSSSSYNIML